MTESRDTKYSQAILQVLADLGHATNAELLDRLRQQFPDLSATTVHRATTRLAERAQIGVAPSTPDGSMRYDAQTEPHDHFTCTHCGRLRDIQVASLVIPVIEKSLGSCKITGRLVISGSCSACIKGEMA